MLTQRTKLSPPLAADKESLADYSAVLQGIFDQLFEASHIHSIRTTAPASNEGSPGDVQLVVVGGVYSIYAKFPTVGWKSVTLS